MEEVDKNNLSSDDSDEDFVPEGEENLLSEEESDEENESDQDKEDLPSGNKRSKHRKSTKRRKLNITKEGEDDNSKETTKKEEPTKTVDDLWAEFTSDTTDPPKTEKKESDDIKPVTVTKEYNFAGETVKVKNTLPSSTLNTRGRGRGRGGGLSGILGNLGKPSKISILDKSKLDWQQFKQKEGIEEELSSFNKGKDGYLEKQEFLQRADFRQFEQEKDLRNATRKTFR